MNKPTTAKMTGIMAATILAMAVFSIAGLVSPLKTAEAAMISNGINTYTLKNSPTGIQMVGTANYPTFHYVIMTAPANGQIQFDGATGEAFYQPNIGFQGVDSFTYKIVSNYSQEWFSNTATVKIAVVENWTAFYPEKVTPVVLAQYVKDKSMTSATVNEIPGVTNIEPYKQTPQGKVAYSNVKAAWEMSGNSWWSLTLGQKQWLMDNLHNKAFVFYGLGN